MALAWLHQAGLARKNCRVLMMQRLYRTPERWAIIKPLLCSSWMGINNRMLRNIFRHTGWQRQLFPMYWLTTLLVLLDRERSRLSWIWRWWALLLRMPIRLYTRAQIRLRD